MGKLEEYRWPVLKGLTISLFFLYFFIKGKLLGNSNFYDLLNLTFGVYYYFLILCPMVLISIGFIGNKRKESVLRIRLFSAILFFFFCTFIYMVRTLNGYEYRGIVLEQKFVEVAWNELNLGGAATSLMHLIYFNMDAELLLKILTGCTAVSGLVAFIKLFTDSIRWVIKRMAARKERLELEKRDKELYEKISIKEEIDKKMNLKKQKSLKQKEEKIQQEVDRFIQEEAVKKDEEILSLDDILAYAKAEGRASENEGKKDESQPEEGEKNDTSI